MGVGKIQTHDSELSS